MGTSTRPRRARPWPNHAKEARDRSAEQSVRGLNALRPLFDKPLTDFTATEIIWRVGIALDALNTIARHLESQGAQTRPQ